MNRWLYASSKWIDIGLMNNVWFIRAVMWSHLDLEPNSNLLLFKRIKLIQSIINWFHQPIIQIRINEWWSEQWWSRFAIAASNRSFDHHQLNVHWTLFSLIRSERRTFFWISIFKTKRCYSVIRSGFIVYTRLIVCNHWTMFNEHHDHKKQWDRTSIDG